MYKVIAAYKPEDTNNSQGLTISKKKWGCYSTPSTPGSYAYDVCVWVCAHMFVCVRTCVWLSFN